MDLYTPEDLPDIYDTLKQRLLDGEVCILPTDTIYGLSGNALDENVVEKILAIKGRKSPPSIIPHSPDWARLLVDEESTELFDKYISRYFGNYTTLWKYSNRFVQLPEDICSTGLVGMRFPDHWIYRFAQRVQVPLVTTSVNRHTEPYVKSLEDLPDFIREALGFMVYEGPRDGAPSTIVHCYEGYPFKVQER